MTNTHINVGGHKITTNKVGTVHTITTLAGGLSGSVKWCVTNGLCTISLRAIRASATYTGVLVSSGLPPAKFGCVAPLADNGVTYGYFYVDQGSTYIQIASLTANADIYGVMTYPVADDWVES